MFLGLIKNEKFIPSLYVNTIFDIDYTKLYEKGIRLILTDLDNTMISYKEAKPNVRLLEYIQKRKEEGFEVIIVSNNSHKKRVSSFAREMDIDYVNFALKPLKCGYKKAMRKASKKYKKSEIMAIGDQLMTDIFAANRCGFYSVLVKACDRKTEIFTTRFNRRLEKHVLNKLKKKNYQLYELTLKEYEEMNYGKN